MAAEKTSTTTEVAPEAKQEELPPLSYGILTAGEDREAALRLVTDSIAQQGQTANASVIFHPLCLAGLVSGLAAILRARQPLDLGTSLITVTGCIIAYLAAVRMLTGKFVRLAEAFRPREFIVGPDGREDMVMGARFGEEIIGAVILRPYLVEPESEEAGKKSKKSTTKAPPGGTIRAWTVRMKYRNKGVGGDLLRSAIIALQTIQGKGAEITFDDEHANSTKMSSEMFNRTFHKRDSRAKAALKHAEVDCESQKTAFDDSFKKAVLAYVKATGKQ